MSGLLVLLTAGMLWAGQEKGDAPPTGFYLSITPSAVYPFSVETDLTGPITCRDQVEMGRWNGRRSGVSIQ